MNSSSAQTVGFVGLGNIGSRMARNVLQKAGYQMVAYDIHQPSLETVVALGAAAASSPAEVAAASDIIITMLPSDPHVLKVYLDGDTGVLSKAKSGALLINCTSCAPQTSQQIAMAAAERGCNLVDAPVSGRTAQAEQGTLTFMVGASSKDAFREAEVILTHLGKKIVYCGDVGTGQAARICNTLVLGISMAAVCEGHILGERLGLDPKALADIMNSSTGRCWSSDSYNPCPGVMEGVPSSRGYVGNLPCDVMVKEMGVAIAAATNNEPRLALPTTSLVHNLYTRMSSHGSGAKDFSGLYEFLSEAKKAT